MIQKLPAPIVCHVVQNLCENKHPHIATDNHADHIGHIEDRAKQSLRPSATFDCNRKSQRDHVGNNNYNNDVSEGKPHGIPKVTVGKKLDKIG